MILNTYQIAVDVGKPAAFNGKDTDKPFISKLFKLVNSSFEALKLVPKNREHNKVGTSESFKRGRVMQL